MPRADDLPAFTTAFNVVPADDNPLGGKGIGEGPTTGSPPAVVNAVLDALRAAASRRWTCRSRPSASGGRSRGRRESVLE